MAHITLHCLALRFAAEATTWTNPWTGKEVTGNELAPMFRGDRDAVLEFLSANDFAVDGELGVLRFSFGDCSVAIDAAIQAEEPPVYFDVTIGPVINSDATDFIGEILRRGDLGAFLDNSKVTIGSRDMVGERVPSEFQPFYLCADSKVLSDCLLKEVSLQEHAMESLKKKYSSPWITRRR